MAQGRGLGHSQRGQCERSVTMRKALGDFRREATRYGGLLNLLAARFASQRLTRHPNVSWSKAR